MAIKTKKDLEARVKQIAKEYTKLLTDEIKDQDLIDTGRMLRETAAKVTVGNDGDFSISVVSTSYYQYVDGRFKVTDNAFSGAKFLRLNKKLAKAIAEYIASSISRKSK
jgi:hypothetical protein